MLKKIIVGTLIVLLAGAVTVGAYAASQGNSSFDLPNIDLAQANGAAGPQGNGGMRGQSQQQGRGQHGQQAQGSAAGQPQAINAQWRTVTGSVVSANAQSLVVETDSMGQLTLQLGQPGFAGEQGVTFNPGDTVIIAGFDGENGLFVAGEITNSRTGAALLLRDPNGRPLWAGRGQGGGGFGQNRGN